MKVINQQITLKELQKEAEETFGDMVKAVVDLENGCMAIGGEMHADEEALLLSHGSKQENVWGINIYPSLDGDEWVEFDSMINMRPLQGNMSRVIESDGVKKRIRNLVAELVKR